MKRSNCLVRLIVLAGILGAPSCAGASYQCNIAYKAHKIADVVNDFARDSKVTTTLYRDEGGQTYSRTVTTDDRVNIDTPGGYFIQVLFGDLKIQVAVYRPGETEPFLLALVKGVPVSAGRPPLTLHSSDLKLAVDCE